MTKICSTNRGNSPLCWDRDLFYKGKQIFESRWVPFDIALWIMNAESNVGSSYAGTCTTEYNNWWGIKRRKLDDGTSVRDQKIPNNWCRLYKFDSVEDYFTSKANTLWIGYKACFSKADPVRCISYAYVGDPNVAEANWIRNVLSFVK